MLKSIGQNYGITCFEVIYDHSKVKTPDQSKMKKVTGLGVTFPDGEVYVQGLGLHFHHLQEMKDFLERQGTIFSLNGEGLGEQ